jgi:hypothetical protein
MAGYYGYSMSNNAISAYENGERPLSKWTKADILEEIELAIKKEDLTLNCSMEKLKKIPVKLLKDLCLSYSSWHHTSNHYNKTDFYSLDLDRIERLSDERIDSEIADYKQEQTDNKAESIEEKWKCAFLEWGGTRKHPKATEIIEDGIIKGDWFYRKDGTKKKTSANGFRFIEKLND